MSQLGAPRPKRILSRRDTRSPLYSVRSADAQMKVDSTRVGVGTPSYCLRFANPAEAATNFERPFTPRTYLRSPRNFGKTRFRRFATFDLLTPKKILRNFLKYFFQFFIIFDRFWRSYGFFDVKIRFLEAFCFRWSNCAVGTAFGAHDVGCLRQARHSTVSLLSKTLCFCQERHCVFAKKNIVSLPRYNVFRGRGTMSLLAKTQCLFWPRHNVFLGKTQNLSWQRHNVFLAKDTRLRIRAPSLHALRHKAPAASQNEAPDHG